LMTGEEVRPDITRFRGEAGDWIVLLTDGITGGEEDTWLREAMSAFDGVSPGVLAERVLTKSGEEQRGADDSTVIAVRLESRKA
ncbi:MAG: stage sporulation protein, partial [Firmicutes bacterium]|nr:stage sporulation protein [Bacillota bacterium]